jgi:hypothetical protein
MFRLIGLKVINPNYDVNSALEESQVVVVKPPKIQLTENKKETKEKKCC